MYIDPVGNIRDQPGSSRRRRDLKKRERKNSISIYFPFHFIICCCREYATWRYYMVRIAQWVYNTSAGFFSLFFIWMEFIISPKKGQPGVVSRPKLICTIQLSTWVIFFPFYSFLLFLIKKEISFKFNRCSNAYNQGLKLWPIHTFLKSKKNPKQNELFITFPANSPLIKMRNHEMFPLDQRRKI